MWNDLTVNRIIPSEVSDSSDFRLLMLTLSDFQTLGRLGFWTIVLSDLGTLGLLGLRVRWSLLEGETHFHLLTQGKSILITIRI